MNIDSDRINFLFSGSGSLIGPNVAFLPQDSHFTGPHTNTGGMEKRSRKLNGAPVVMRPKTCCRLQAGPESSPSRGTFQSDLQSHSQPHLGFCGLSEDQGLWVEISVASCLFHCCKQALNQTHQAEITVHWPAAIFLKIIIFCFLWNVLACLIAGFLIPFRSALH